MNAMQFIRSTCSGIAFDLANPTPAMIDPADIAWHLSMINRWCGNLRLPYSVAQHSVLVARAIERPDWRIYGLLHDAGEAYTGDIISPLKQMIQLGGFDIVGAEHRIFATVLVRLGLPPMTAEIAQAVHEADQQALAAEYRDVVGSQISGWSPSATPFHDTVVPVNCDAAYAMFLHELGVHLSAVWDGATANE